MPRPRLLDLFCGAGGSAMGYHRAGFEVVGVDIAPQPHYPFEFHQGDAMTWPLAGFDAIHASPPCQAFTVAQVLQKRRSHPDLLTPIRARLLGQPSPWVIENVPRAPMRADYRLCGCQFDLGANDAQLLRPRWFETSWHGFALMMPCRHPAERTIPVFGDNPTSNYYRRYGRGSPIAERREAMGIDWMTRDELAEAIPPAYTEYIGSQLLSYCREEAPTE